MLDLDLLLKRNELCLIGRAPHHNNMEESGLYIRDTRFLNAFSVSFRGEALRTLDMQSSTPETAIITSTNPQLEHPGPSVPSNTILFQQEIGLDTTLRVTLTVQNFGTSPIEGDLSITIDSDFRDMFDIRGMTPRERATTLPATTVDGGVELAARGSDGRIVSTLVSSTPAANIVTHTANDVTSGATLSYHLDLRRDGIQVIELRMMPKPIGAPLEHPGGEEPGNDWMPHVVVCTPSEPFNAFVAQCDRDLALLQTTFPHGDIPAAGIPWFIAPFGRDSLIVGLQTLHAYPYRAASILRALASLQGRRTDPWREEQPGKILHEMRYGEMARTGQIPHTPYFGSIDSTPLFIMLFAQHYLWHRDDSLFDDLIGNVRQALEWIDTYGDVDGDGFIEFSGLQQDKTRIAQQGWKDSGDSLHFADGRDVEGPIALVEVQGYVYAAYQWLSKAMRLRGDRGSADELMSRAERIRVAVESAFWMEDAGFYAQALDGKKQQVDAISSNPGHLLFCGLPTAERAARVARRLAATDMNGGWGIRTLSDRMATYNPMSYHNGSIWPHDISLTMVGLRTYGHDHLARDLALDLLALATSQPDLRLAELYCGFPRADNTLGPVHYPVSCSPQAWAAGAGLLAVHTLLGLRPDSEHEALTLNPHLPDDWDEMSVSGLHAFGALTNVSVKRNDAGYTITIDDQGAR